MISPPWGSHLLITKDPTLMTEAKHAAASALKLIVQASPVQENAAWKPADYRGNLAAFYGEDDTENN